MLAPAVHARRSVSIVVVIVVVMVLVGRQHQDVRLQHALVDELLHSLERHRHGQLALVPLFEQPEQLVAVGVQLGLEEQLREVVELRGVLRRIVHGDPRLVEQGLDLGVQPLHICLLLVVGERAHGGVVLLLPLDDGGVGHVHHALVGAERHVEGHERCAHGTVLVPLALLGLLHLLPVLAQQLLKLAGLGRVLPQLRHDGRRDVVQLVLRRLPLLHQVVPEPLEQEVNVLVELQPHLLQLLLHQHLLLRARAVGLDFTLHLRLVVAHHAQQPRAVLREHLHVVHLVLQPLLQQRAQPHQVHVGGVLLLAVVARALQRVAPLHVYRVRRAAQRSRQSDNGHHDREQDLEEEVLPHYVGALLVARTNLGGVNRQEGAVRAGGHLCLDCACSWPGWFPRHRNASSTAQT
eukprot:scaffold61396_cov63-Phaeocystis_antarctica.AAC.4